MIVHIYQDKKGNEPFHDWLDSIKDKRTRARIDNRIKRVRLGNLGDRQSLGGSLYELRLHFGAGYRIYYGRVSDNHIILLLGGDKNSQAQDLEKVKHYWEDYKELMR